MFKRIVFGISVFVFCLGYTQQRPDTLFNPIIKKKSYDLGKGSAIHIDEAHNNFHTKNNRFLPFARLLEQDGYVVKGFETNFTSENLSGVKILVISNALARDARQPFVRPTKSAFTKDEIKSLRHWVKKGGSLFLIADHMPFAGAAADLGKAFGFNFYDSFLFEKTKRGPIDFSLSNKMLVLNKVTEGKEKLDKVNIVRTFTGQAFKIPNRAKSILTVDENHIVRIPDTMWIFNAKTKTMNAKGLSQGAYMKFGKGRVVVFGEAAMFTAQLAGPNRFKVGMNAEGASENYKLLLNIIHWLDRLY